SDRLRHFFRPGGDVVVQSVGGFAEATIVPATNLVPLPADVPFDVGTIAGCSVVTGVGAVLNVAHVGPGDHVAVIGRGGFGINALDLLLNQKRVIGCLRGDVRPAVDFLMIFDLYRQGRLPLDELVTARISLDDIAAGFDQAASAKGIRAVIQM